MNNEATLEDFRRQVYPELIRKGVKPPALGSAHEHELFGEWQRGREKLGKTSV